MYLRSFLPKSATEVNTPRQPLVRRDGLHLSFDTFRW
jgi:hypothetical protein